MILKKTVKAIINNNINILANANTKITEKHIKNFKKWNVKYIYIEGKSTKENDIKEIVDIIKGIIIEKNTENDIKNAIKLLQDNPDDNIIHDLILYYKSINNENIRINILDALKTFKSDDIINICLTEIKIGGIKLKKKAIECLTNKNPDLFLIPLLNIYSYQSIDIKSKIEKCFSNMNRKHIINLLKNIIIHDDSIETKNNAFNILKKLKNNSSEYFLLLHERYILNSEYKININRPEKIFNIPDNININTKELFSLYSTLPDNNNIDFTPIELNKKETKNNYKIFYENTISFIVNTINLLLNNKQINTKKTIEIISKIDYIVKNNKESIKNIIKFNNSKNYLPFHILNSLILSIGWSNYLNLSKKEKSDLIISAFLYDTGMALVRNFTWNKSKTLENYEKQYIHYHPLYTINMIVKNSYLLKSPFISKNIFNICLFHHENNDNSGYPFGKNIELQLLKMLKIIDSFEAITKNRIYRNRKSNYESIRLMKLDKIKYDYSLLNNFYDFLRDLNFNFKYNPIEDIILVIGEEKIDILGNRPWNIINSSQKKFEDLIEFYIPDKVIIDFKNKIDEKKENTIKKITKLISPKDIIILTETPYKSDIIVYMKYGIKNILKKPYKSEELIKKLA